MTNEKIKLIGYGSFMKDVLEQLAIGNSPTTWGEPITVLGPISVNGFHRLWPKEFYPIVVPSETKSFIGLLLEINKSQLPRFDQIEGAPRFYEREEITIEWEEETISAFIYIAGINLINNIFDMYKRKGLVPGDDDWLDYLAEILSPNAKNVFPGIFLNKESI